MDEEVSEALEETVPLPHLPAAALALTLALPVLLSLREKLGDEVELRLSVGVGDKVLDWQMVA